MNATAREYITIKKKEYRLDVGPYNSYDGSSTPVWTAYRSFNGQWERINAMSRSECHRFPKSVARAANVLLEKAKMGAAKLEPIRQPL